MVLALTVKEEIKNERKKKKIRAYFLFNIFVKTNNKNE